MFAQLLILITLFMGAGNIEAQDSLKTQETSQKKHNFAQEPPAPKQLPQSSQSTEDIRNMAQKTYKNAAEELNSLIRYIGFGILIALFYMHDHSTKNNKHRFNLCIALITASTTLLALLFHAVMHLHMLTEAEKIIAAPSTEGLCCSYTCMRGISMMLFWGCLCFLGVSTISFLILAYEYFFGKDSTA